MMKKTERTYWYTDVDMHQLLIEYSHAQSDYKIIDNVDHNYTSIDLSKLFDQQSSEQYFLSLRIRDAVNFLNHNTLNGVVIPINLGGVTNKDNWEGKHWVGLVIRRNQNEKLEAIYCDSLGISLDQQLPFLRETLTDNNIKDKHIHDQTSGKKQQHHPYDCGPWTIYNLDTIARNGVKSKLSFDENKIKAQRKLLNPYYDDSSDEESDYKKITNHHLGFFEKRLSGTDKTSVLVIKKEPKNIKNLDSGDLQLSFILHELAIRLLKSKKVNKKYYETKAQKLQKTLDLTKKDFDQAFLELISNWGSRNHGANESLTNRFFNEIANTKTYQQYFAASQHSVRAQNKYITERKELSEIVFPEDYDVTHWLRAIRLINRSCKRHIRNYEDIRKKEGDLTAEKKSQLSITIIFLSLDQQVSIQYNITNNNSNSSLVSNLGAYKKIKDTLNNIKKSFNVNDKQIADMVIATLNNQRYDFATITNNRAKQLVKYVTHLTCLLFIEEAHRNPASLLCHHMMLDLIKDSVLSWDDAIKIMPMSPQGATYAGLWLNQNYATSAAYLYDYREKITCSVEVPELIRNEATLFKKWFNHHTQQEPDIYTRLDLLIQHIKVWYGVNLKETFLSEAYLNDVEYNARQQGLADNIELNAYSLSQLRMREIADITMFISNYHKQGLDKLINFNIDIADLLPLFRQHGIEFFNDFITDEKVLDLLKNFVYEDTWDTDAYKTIEEIVHLYKNDKARFLDLVNFIEEKHTSSIVDKGVGFSNLFDLYVEDNDKFDLIADNYKSFSGNKIEQLIGDDAELVRGLVNHEGNLDFNEVRERYYEKKASKNNDSDDELTQSDVEDSTFDSVVDEIEKENGMDGHYDSDGNFRYSSDEEYSFS